MKFSFVCLSSVVADSGYTGLPLERLSFFKIIFQFFINIMILLYIDPVISIASYLSLSLPLNCQSFPPPFLSYLPPSFPLLRSLPPLPSSSACPCSPFSGNEICTMSVCNASKRQCLTFIITVSSLIAN